LLLICELLFRHVESQVHLLVQKLRRERQVLGEELVPVNIPIEKERVDPSIFAEVSISQLVYLVLTVNHLVFVIL